MSITINYGVTALGWIVLFVTALVIYLPRVNVSALLGASVAEILVVAVFTYPFSKTITAAADLLVHNAHRGVTADVAARFGLRP